MKLIVVVELEFTLLVTKLFTLARITTLSTATVPTF